MKSATSAEPGGGQSIRKHTTILSPQIVFFLFFATPFLNFFIIMKHFCFLISRFVVNLSVIPNQFLPKFTTPTH